MFKDAERSILELKDVKEKQNAEPGAASDPLGLFMARGQARAPTAAAQATSRRIQDEHLVVETQLDRFENPIL